MEDAKRHVQMNTTYYNQAAFDHALHYMLANGFFAVIDETLSFAGIELDVQLTADGVPVVIHDERIDRTTDGTGYVKDFSFKELKTFHIHNGSRDAERIPSFEEVLDLLSPTLKRGMMLNVELKTGVFPYSGIEKKTIEMVRSFGVEESIVYSSFYARSLEIVHEMDPGASIGVLDAKASDCLYKCQGLHVAGALHPYWKGMDLTKEKLEGYTVRAWLSGHLYPEKPTGNKLDLDKLEEKGITDVILNEQERYLE